MHPKRYKQENKGVSVSRNLGIERANGEFIAFLDSDDYYLESNTLELLYKKAHDYGVDICGGSLSSFDEKKQKISINFSGYWSLMTFLVEKKITFKDYQCASGFYRYIFRRDFLIQKHIYFPKYKRFQDPPFLAKALVSVKEFLIIPQVTYCYRIGHKNLEWDDIKICDLIRGLTDLLSISSEYNLNYLHTFTVRRIIESQNIIIKAIRRENPDISRLLSLADSKINPSLLPIGFKYYSLWYLLVELDNKQRNLKLSKSYILGHFLLYPLRRFLRIFRTQKLL